jgi:hypothetical protein
MGHYIHWDAGTALWRFFYSDCMTIQDLLIYAYDYVKIGYIWDDIFYPKIYIYKKIKRVSPCPTFFPTLPLALWINYDHCHRLSQNTGSLLSSESSSPASCEQQFPKKMNSSRATHEPNWYFIFARNSRIYSINSQEVQGNPNITKITLRSLNHLTTTTTTTGAIHRRAVVAAPIPELA